MKSTMIRSEKRSPRKSNPFSGRRVTPRFYTSILTSVAVILITIAIVSVAAPATPEPTGRIMIVPVDATPTATATVSPTVAPTAEPVQETFAWGTAYAEELPVDEVMPFTALPDPDEPLANPRLIRPDLPFGGSRRLAQFAAGGAGRAGHRR